MSTTYVAPHQRFNASRSDVGNWRSAPKFSRAVSTPPVCKYSSIGMILYTETEKGIKYALVKRRISYGLHQVLTVNISTNMYVEEVSNEEKKSLLEVCELKGDFEATYRKLWQDAWWGAEATNESLIKRSMARFLNMRSVIRERLLKVDSIFPNGVWGFPKGKNDKHQNEVMCALREVREETGLSSACVQIQPFDAVVEEFKHWTYKYFIAKVPCKEAVNRDMTKHTSEGTDISEVVWLTFEDALNLIPPVMEEKRKLLISLNAKLCKGSQGRRYGC